MIVNLRKALCELCGVVGQYMTHQCNVISKMLLKNNANRHCVTATRLLWELWHDHREVRWERSKRTRVPKSF
jgi:hypothetical protein